MWLKCLEDLIFPRKCEVCGRLLPVDVEYLCDDCMEDMPLTYYWDWPENPAEKKLWVRTYLNRVIPLFFYTRESRYITLIHKIKYQGKIGLGLYMGRLLGKKIKRSLPDIDYIVPVPLHPLRKWRRGYNQAEVIARGVAEAMFGPSDASDRVLTDVLKRVRYTRTQTRRKMDDKWSNVANAFRPHNTKDLSGKHILIIDDVLTTGATLEACATILVEQLGCRVSIATLAYVE
ncbi:MAG: ComF family protein [Bacteroidales bacterium]|nr:ComF family protein [Bacteroidales bacterium]